MNRAQTAPVVGVEALADRTESATQARRSRLKAPHQRSLQECQKISEDQINALKAALPGGNLSP